MLRFCRSSTSRRNSSICFLVSASWLRRSVVGALQRRLDGLDLDRQLAVDLADPVAELDHGRIGRLERLQLVLVFAGQHIALRPQADDDAVVEELRQIDRGDGLDLAPDLFVLDALADQATEGGVGGGEVVLGDRRFLVDDNDLLLLGEVEQRLFRRFQPQLQLLRLILEEGLGVGIGLEPLVDVGRDVGVGIGIGDALGAGRNRIGVGDVDQPGARHRPHRAIAKNDAASPWLDRCAGRRFARRRRAPATPGRGWRRRSRSRAASGNRHPRRASATRSPARRWSGSATARTGCAGSRCRRPRRWRRCCRPRRSWRRCDRSEGGLLPYRAGSASRCARRRWQRTSSECSRSATCACRRCAGTRTAWPPDRRCRRPGPGRSRRADRTARGSRVRWRRREPGGLGRRRWADCFRP